MLKTEKLTFAYEASAPLIDEWDESFAAGQLTAITGPSGRGKSTLLYLLGLMLRPVAGSVLIDGLAVSSLSDRERARLRAHQFGFVFQDAALDPSRSVIDNIVEGSLYRLDDPRAAARRARDLMNQFGVDLRANAKPGQISGGQAQRVALCRALLGDPRFILADEPTGNLDSVTADVVVRAFRDSADAGAAVVIVTHDLDLVTQCDRRVDL